MKRWLVLMAVFLGWAAPAGGAVSPRVESELRDPSRGQRVEVVVQGAAPAAVDALGGL
jgi:hypothetical protein